MYRIKRMNLRDLLVSWANSPPAVQMFAEDKGAAAERARIVAFGRKVAAGDGDDKYHRPRDGRVLNWFLDKIESRQHLRPPADGESARELLPDILVRNDADNWELMRLRTWAKNALRIDDFEKSVQK